MSDFSWGVLTAFLLAGGLALALGLAYLLVALARHLWAKTHYALMDSVDIAPNRQNPYRGAAQDKPEYLDSANKIRDALLESPRMYTVAGLGWRAVIVRETTTKEPS